MFSEFVYNEKTVAVEGSKTLGLISLLAFSLFKTN